MGAMKADRQAEVEEYAARTRVRENVIVGRPAKIHERSGNGRGGGYQGRRDGMRYESQGVGARREAGVSGETLPNDAPR
jgi:hypothetical protein